MTFYVGKVHDLMPQGVSVEARKVKVRSYTRKGKGGKRIRVKESQRTAEEIQQAYREKVMARFPEARQQFMKEERMRGPHGERGDSRYWGEQRHPPGMSPKTRMDRILSPELRRQRDREMEREASMSAYERMREAEFEKHGYRPRIKRKSRRRKVSDL